MYYFAYGSNMPRKRIEDRVGTVTDLGVGVLDKNTIKFNKLSSIDGSGKTNIVTDENSRVLGVVYELASEQLKLLDESELGYDRVSLPVELKGKQLDMEVYIAQARRVRDNLLPTREYLEYLIQGAKEHDFPPDYIKLLGEVESRG